ncbi:hypothetical protein Plhal304r1_c032g0103461 [Plasmopara halstedii]
MGWNNTSILSRARQDLSTQLNYRFFHVNKKHRANKHVYSNAAGPSVDGTTGK